MRIVSWNCHYGFDGEKPETIKKLDADILVVQECKEEDGDRLSYAKERGDWYGDGLESTGDPKKSLGVGVFCKEGITITRLPEWDKSLRNDKRFRYLVPYKVEGKFGSFTLFAVWTKGKIKTDADDTHEYTEKAHAAIQQYHDTGLLNGRVVLIGDFNTGSIQGTYNAERYEKLKRAFAEKKFQNCANGQEWVPTFFRGSGSWLDDHCFASSDIQVVSFGIGNSDYWRKYSDHCPIIVDFDF
jgi:endonuclease/exonuclease/phosphatase family metal-dependent hydrolase